MLLPAICLSCLNLHHHFPVSNMHTYYQCPQLLYICHVLLLLYLLCIHLILALSCFNPINSKLCTTLLLVAVQSFDIKRKPCLYLNHLWLQLLQSRRHGGKKVCGFLPPPFQSWTWWFRAVVCSCYTLSGMNWKLAVGHLEVCLIECCRSQPDKFVNVNRSCFSICSLEKCDKDEQSVRCRKCQGHFHIWMEALVGVFTHPL